MLSKTAIYMAGFYLTNGEMTDKPLSSGIVSWGVVIAHHLLLWKQLSRQRGFHAMWLGEMTDGWPAGYLRWAIVIRPTIAMARPYPFGRALHLQFHSSCVAITRRWRLQPRVLSLRTLLLMPVRWRCRACSSARPMASGISQTRAASSATGIALWAGFFLAALPERRWWWRDMPGRSARGIEEVALLCFAILMLRISTNNAAATLMSDADIGHQRPLKCSSGIARCITAGKDAHRSNAEAE